MKRFIFSSLVLLTGAVFSSDAEACTGISLQSRDGSNIVARTVEWAATPMNCAYVIVPRGQKHQSYTPTGLNGIKYSAKYGYVGIYTEYEPFVVEGVNEAGLSVGLFFFPSYGSYQNYDFEDNDETLCDMQFVSWALSRFSSISQIQEALDEVDVVSLNHKIGAVHWRITERNGRMAVLEYVDGEPHLYDNHLGVLTNSPGFQWHMTNLDNYVNLQPGAAANHSIKDGVELRAIGGGSGMIGLPGDFTPPSRFVRAAFFQTSAPVLSTGAETVIQAFHLLNNFDIPIGIQHPIGKTPEGLPSATQFTSATDLKSLRLYYRTAWNSTIRCIDLTAIDFDKVKYQSHPLDKDKIQPVEMVEID